MGQVIDAYKWADMLVFASPICYCADKYACIRHAWMMNEIIERKELIVYNTSSANKRRNHPWTSKR